jgi:hypothetical protein
MLDCRGSADLCPESRLGPGSNLITVDGADYATTARLAMGDADSGCALAAS